MAKSARGLLSRGKRPRPDIPKHGAPPHEGMMTGRAAPWGETEGRAGKFRLALLSERLCKG